MSFTQAELRSAINGATVDMLAFIKQHQIAVNIDDLSALEDTVKSVKHPEHARYLQLAKHARLALRELLTEDGSTLKK